MRRPSDAFVSYIASLHRAVHSLGLYLDSSVSGVTQPEAIVLLYLRTAAPQATINDVHAAFLHRRSTLTSVLDRMESRGLLTRTPSAKDRRSLALALTAAGRGAADRVATAIARLERRIGPTGSQVAAAGLLLDRTARIAGESIDEI